MVWDDPTKTHTEALADKRERAMGSHTGTTVDLGLFEANDTLCWTKPWILIPWCSLLVYALHCNDTMMIDYCLWGQGTLVKGHNGPHPWKNN